MLVNTSSPLCQVNFACVFSITGVECPAGKAQGATGQISCTDCSAGTYNNATGVGVWSAALSFFCSIPFYYCSFYSTTFKLELSRELLFECCFFGMLQLSQGILLLHHWNLRGLPCRDSLRIEWRSQSSKLDNRKGILADFSELCRCH